MTSPPRAAGRSRGAHELLPGSNLSGDGTIAANVTSAATTSPGNGNTAILTIDGNFSQYGDGVLNIQLVGTTAGTQFDQLDVTGAAALGGTLAVSLANGYTPQVGDTFSVLTYSSRSGEFGTYSGLGYASGHTLRTLFGTSDLSLSAALSDIRVFPTTGLITSKAGDSASFTVVLATPPTADVTLDLSSSNNSEGAVSPSSLVFTSANWSTPQTVTITGVDDGQTGSVPYQVTFDPATSTDPNYSGLQAVPVSLTNLPSEVRNIDVTNLAVTPSSGLNQGSNLTVTWDDTNTGNIPPTVAWYDRVVITNTTTGVTLTTADVLTDPNVLGPLAPGGSLARQFAFTLPSGADGIGNIQVSVTSNVHFNAFEQGTSLANSDLRGSGNGQDYPIAPTTLTVGGVDFALVPEGTSTTSLGIIQTNGSFDIPVNIAGATTLYTLINSIWGTPGDTVGTVEVKGTGGADAVFNLVEGTNIRDYNNDGFENSVAAGTPSASFGNGQVRLDRQTFVLPAAFATARITDIIFNGTGGYPQGSPFMAAATVATSSGPSQLVLLGRGVAPDVLNSQTITVASGGNLAAQVSLALDPSSDSGASSSDDRTNVTLPAFDVTVNQAGSIELDVQRPGGRHAIVDVCRHHPDHPDPAPRRRPTRHQGDLHPDRRHRGAGQPDSHDRHPAPVGGRRRCQPSGPALQPCARLQRGDRSEHVDPRSRHRDRSRRSDVRRRFNRRRRLDIHPRVRPGSSPNRRGHL